MWVFKIFFRVHWNSSNGGQSTISRHSKSSTSMLKSTEFCGRTLDCAPEKPRKIQTGSQLDLFSKHTVCSLT